MVNRKHECDLRVGRTRVPRRRPTAIHIGTSGARMWSLLVPRLVHDISDYAQHAYGHREQR